MRVSGERIRILSLPGRKFKGINPFFFCDSLENEGGKIVDIKSLRALTFRFDIIHIHFPEHYVTEQSLVNAIKWTIGYTLFFLLAKTIGKKIVWQVHDVLPFKRRHLWLLNPYMRLVHALTDAHVFLNKSSRSEFISRHPASAAKLYCLAPHGPYKVDPFDEIEKESRQELQITSEYFVVGYLGAIKNYKNPSALRSIPTHLANGRPVCIVIAGAADQETRDEVKRLEESLKGRVIRIDKHLQSNGL